MSEIIRPILDDSKLKKFVKVIDKQQQDIFISITEDAGTGSIFKNIL